jgi:hypothetical protein
MWEKLSETRAHHNAFFWMCTPLKGYGAWTSRWNSMFIFPGIRYHQCRSVCHISSACHHQRCRIWGAALPRALWYYTWPCIIWSATDVQKWRTICTVQLTSCALQDRRSCTFSGIGNLIQDMHRGQDIVCGGKKIKKTSSKEVDRVNNYYPATAP